MNNNNCRVCGLYIENKPWGEDNQTPTYEICPCCGVEFGNEDYTISSVKVYREEWIKNGCNWFIPNEKPINWDMEKQLLSIPIDFI